MKYKLISVNAKVARSVNRATILNLIRENQPISRIQLSRITGLNKSTISSIVSALIDENLIYEEINQDNNIGRNPLSLYLKKNKYFVGAVNIDHIKSRIAIADIDGSIIAKTSLNTVKDPAKLFEKITAELSKLKSDKKINKLYGLGVTVAGIVDSNKGLVEYAPNLSWENIDIKSIIEKLLPAQENVVIGNDAKSSALAELWFTKYDADLSNFVFLSVGAGIGTGIVIEKDILEGEYNAAGEFGHIKIFHKGKQCTCGEKGCWEAYASDRATVERYNKKSGLNVKTVAKVIENSKTDRFALEALKETGYYIGLGIENIIKTVDPNAIIIGGKVTKAWDVIFPEIKKVLDSDKFLSTKKDLLIMPTSLNVRPRLLGAATLAIRAIFNDYNEKA